MAAVHAAETKCIATTRANAECDNIEHAGQCEVAQNQPPCVWMPQITRTVPRRPLCRVGRLTFPASQRNAMQVPVHLYVRQRD